LVLDNGREPASSTVMDPCSTRRGRRSGTRRRGHRSGTRLRGVGSDRRNSRAEGREPGGESRRLERRRSAPARSSYGLIDPGRAPRRRHRMV